MEQEGVLEQSRQFILLRRILVSNYVLWLDRAIPGMRTYELTNRSEPQVLSAPTAPNHRKGLTSRWLRLMVRLRMPTNNKFLP